MFDFGVCADEFKPASIDKTKPGSLRKSKENRVNIEFQNNQIGKPKLTFEGSSEDYKDNDAVLFFDGETFRLERLHRSVKQIRLLRQPGESNAAAAVASSAAPSGPVAETRLSPIGKAGKPVHARSTSSLPAVPVSFKFYVELLYIDFVCKIYSFVLCLLSMLKDVSVNSFDWWVRVILYNLASSMV